MERLKEKAFQKMKQIQRAIVVVLIAALLIGQVETLNVFASVNTEASAEITETVISGFVELPREVKEQTVLLGTALDALVLPDTLEAVTIVEVKKTEHTESSFPTESPLPTENPLPTESPIPTESPLPTENPLPTESPSATVSPSATEGPLDDESAEDGASATPTATLSLSEGENAEGAQGEASVVPTTAASPAADEDAQEAATQTEELGTLKTETVTETLEEVYSSSSEELTVGTLTQGTSEPVSEEPVDDTADSAETEMITETVIIEGVSWTSAPEYDGEAAGEYTFTAVLPEGYGLAEGVSVPQIIVSVTQEQDGGEIELLTRPYDEETSSDMVYYLESSYESYSWEVWTGEEWQEISAYEPELVVSKEEWYTYQFRCIVKKDGVRFTACAKNDWQIENFGIMLMAADGADSGQSDYMYYFNGTGLYYNIKGIDDGSLIQTTYVDRGYRTASSVNGGSKVDWNSAGEVAMGNSLYGTREISLVYNGRYAKIEYTVENRGSVTQSFQVGSSADVMIADNDRAPVVGSANGLSMTGQPKNSYEFNLVAPTVSTLWYGFFGYAYKEMFTDLADKSVEYTGDSGMAWSWSGDVEPGQTWSRYVLLGVGALPPSPNVPTLTNKDPVLQPGMPTIFTGTAEPGNEVCIEVGGEEFSGTADSDGNFSVEVIPPENLQEGETDINYYAVSPEGGISEVGSMKAIVKVGARIVLTDTSVSVMEDSVLDDAWYRSYIKSSDGTVSYDASEVKTGTPGTYTVTYTANKTGYAGTSVTLDVIVLPLPLELSDVTATRVSGKDSYTLSAALKYTGGETISETGFVWGIMQNPTVSLNNGSKKTASVIKNKGASLSVTAEEIVDSVTYYARAYAKTSDGTVYYSAQKAFSINGKSYGTFTIKNNNNNTFTVTRTGGTDGAQTVYFRTVNGSAVGGTHFTHQASTLTFAEGETSKTITIAEKSVTATYNSEAATAYSNADRTYQVEIYRVEGGGALGTAASAARTMERNSSYAVGRSIYDWQTIEGPQEEKTRGDYDDDKLGWTENKSYEAAKETISIKNNLLTDTRGYWTNTAEKLYYYLTFVAKEGDAGYQAVQITPGSSLDLSVYPYDDTFKGSLSIAYYVALFEHGGSGKQTNWLSHTLPRSSGNTRTLTESSRIENIYVCFDVTQEEMSVGYGACGTGSDTWYTQNVTHHFQLKDTKEPQLLGVAPMAGGTYKEGDKVTISLIFDEIVDSVNSNLSGVSVNTSWGTFTYAGGADTNVLYFTGTVPSNATGTLTVNSITGSQYIKDMCSTSGTAPSGSGSTTVSVDNKRPAVSISNPSITNQTAKATITATNTDTLKYTWNQSGTMPVTGWLTCTSGQEVSTRQISGTWYLHVLGTYNATGSTDYIRQSFNFTGSSGAMPELSLLADNSAWARNRTITLTKTPQDASITVKTPTGATSAVTGTAYTAEANGSYTFILTSNGETVVKSIAVSKIDRTVPEAAITGPDSPAQNENVILTVTPGDAGGSGVKTVSGKWVITTNGGSEVEQAATLTPNADGSYSAATPGSTGNRYTYKLEVAVTDNAGNTASISSDTYTVNLKVPAITVSRTGSGNKGDTYSYTVTANENIITAIQLPDGRITTDLRGSFTLTSPGTYYVLVSDEAGHVVRSDAMTVAAGVDGDAPEVRLYQENEDWTNEPVKIDVSIYEEGTIASAVWKKEGGEPVTEINYRSEETAIYSGEFSVPENGTYTVTVTDNNGNAGTGSITVSNIDVEAPKISFSVNSNEISEEYYDTAPDILVRVVDDSVMDNQEDAGSSVITSGIASVTYQVGSSTPKSDNNSSFTIQASEIPTGETQITVTATDNAGNTASEHITVKVKGPEAKPDAGINYMDETLTGLVANAEYKINDIKQTADENGVIPIESSWLGSTISIVRRGNDSTTVNSDAQSLNIPVRPKAPVPELAGCTDTSITLQTITNAQYRLENGKWQSDTAFSGLTPKTKYTFEAYYPATASSFCSLTGSAVIATSIAAPDENSADKLVIIDYEKETIFISGEVEVFKDAECTQPIDSSTVHDVTDYMGGTIYIRYPADGDFPESAAVLVSIKSPPPVPVISGRDETYPGAGDGVITGMTEGFHYEISSDGGSTWTDAVLSGTEIKGLKPGSYQVRVKAGEENFQSEASSTVIIGSILPTQETVPQAGISYGDGALTGLAPGEKYKVSYTTADGLECTQECTTDEKGNIRFEEEWYGKAIEIVKSGNGKDKTDSVPQSVSVSARPQSPTPNAAGESGSGKNNGSISNLTPGETYEISADGGATWKDVTVDEDGQIKNLKPGNYEIRVKATEDTFNSESVKVSVPAYPSQNENSGFGEAGDYDGNHDGGSSRNDSDSEKEENQTGNNTGKILKEVEKRENAPGIQFSMTTDELAAVVLTDAERQSPEKGTDIKILLIVEDAANSTGSKEKAIIDNEKGMFEVGQYLDISLIKIIGSSSEKITETNGKVRIAINVPDELKSTSNTEMREFAVIRVHNGEAVILNDLDTDENTVTIETNLFSTYALLYRDVPVNGNNRDKNTESKKDNEPKTGDDTHMAPYATVAMIAGLTYLRLYFGDCRCGMSEEEKKELISKIIRWARRGGRLRKILAIAAIIPILMYYHGIGKKAALKWNEVYGL